MRRIGECEGQKAEEGWEDFRSWIQNIAYNPGFSDPRLFHAVPDPGFEIFADPDPGF